MPRISIRSFLKFAESILGVLGVRYVNTKLYMRDMKSQIPSTECPVQIDVVRAKGSSFDFYFKDNAELMRLRSGDECFIALHDGKVISHFWISLNMPVYIPELERTFHFGPNSVYHFDAWVHPDFRNNSIAKKSVEKMFHILKGTGLEKSYTTSRYLPAQKLLLKHNFKPVKIIRYFRLFFYRKYVEENIG